MAILAALSQAIEAGDPYTRGHSVRVTALAESVGIRLGWSEDRLAALRVGGRLHDIGKLVVASHILRKRGRLTDEELEEIRRHPAAGAQMIDGIEGLEPAVPYVLYHHERWDGGGYPSGKSGEEIPLGARLIAVADAYDAMTSLRPYRPPMPPEQALEEVERCAGTQFDPELASVFVDRQADLLTRTA